MIRFSASTRCRSLLNEMPESHTHRKKDFFLDSSLENSEIETAQGYDEEAGIFVCVVARS